MNRLVLICYLIANLGCLFADTNASKADLQPNWVSNPLSEYPASLYLSGIGIGATTSIAEKKALASLAQFFETSVTASTTTRESETSSTSNNVSKTELQSSFANQIETFSSANIQFAEVVKTWQNPNTKNYYVLMVINRRIATEIYYNQIIKSVSLLDIYLEKTDNPLKRYSNLRKAAFCSKDAQPSYYYYNSLADAKLPRLSPELEVGEIEALLNNAGQAICFQISVQADSADIAQNAMHEIIRKMGFTYSQDAALLMRITITPTASKVMGKQIFASYSATLQLYNQNEQVFSLTDQVLQGDTTLEFAKARAFKALANSLSQRFKKEFNKYLEQL
jgi:hypothetical protein